MLCKYVFINRYYRWTHNHTINREPPAHIVRDTRSRGSRELHAKEITESEFWDFVVVCGS